VNDDRRSLLRRLAVLSAGAGLAGCRSATDPGPRGDGSPTPAEGTARTTPRSTPDRLVDGWGLDDAVDPVDPTYDYSPDGASCGACGERVTRRWRDDGGYVCADCKEW
jgi:hypothetical protein